MSLPSPEAAGVPTAATAQRVCGWCWLELAPGTLPATHAICPRCYVLCELDIKRRQEGGTR